MKVETQQTFHVELSRIEAKKLRRSLDYCFHRITKHDKGQAGDLGFIDLLRLQLPL